MNEIKARLAKRAAKFLEADTAFCMPYYTVNHDGYGDMQLTVKNKKIHNLAHRVVYALYHNVELTRDDVVMHECDNPPCCNPKHLKLGTHATNSADKVAKNRHAQGKKNGRYTTGYHAKVDAVEKPKKRFEELFGRSLTEIQASQIKQAIRDKGNKSLRVLGEELGVKYQTMRDLNCGKIYRTAS